jgi:hypothetical protein
MAGGDIRNCCGNRIPVGNVERHCLGRCADLLSNSMCCGEVQVGGDHRSSLVDERLYRPPADTTPSACDEDRLTREPVSRGLSVFAHGYATTGEGLEGAGRRFACPEIMCRRRCPERRYPSKDRFAARGSELRGELLGPSSAFSFVVEVSAESVSATSGFAAAWV